MVFRLDKDSRGALPSEDVAGIVTLRELADAQSRSQLKKLAHAEEEIVNFLYGQSQHDDSDAALVSKSRIACRKFAVSPFNAGSSDSLTGCYRLCAGELVCGYLVSREACYKPARRGGRQAQVLSCVGHLA